MGILLLQNYAKKLNIYLLTKARQPTLLEIKKNTKEKLD
jgi:hypothetical protein